MDLLYTHFLNFENVIVIPALSLVAPASGINNQLLVVHYDKT